MSATNATEMLRGGLLEDTAIMLAGARSGGSRATIAQACTALGARVGVCEIPSPGAGEGGAGEGDLEDRVERALAEIGRIDLLVVDAASLFAGCDMGRSALVIALELSWSLTRAVVARAYLPQAQGGRIVYIAPPGAPAAEHADAARAGLENLARTLSIEWARHAITTVAIAPGEATTAGELATLVAYLASQAGSYFSGCQLDLRGPRG